MEMFSPKQLQFIIESTAHWNLAHGSVRCGKTVCTLFRFFQAAESCPDSQIFMVGHTSDTIYQNAIRLILESPIFVMFRPYCTWYSGKRQLRFKDKVITTMGARDEGALGQFQGKTMSLVYCDEMTLYPESIIDMIDTRLSLPYSMGFASMNPSHPKHKLKQWIDAAEAGDPNYYALHFTLDDIPYVSDDYKLRIRNSLSGIFYKRNYLGLWCLAEGAIFDFFDHKLHVVRRPPAAADYWIASIDYGTNNPFCCLIIGVSTGRYTQTGKVSWVEKEYYWDPKKMGRQKINSEYADDLEHFFQDYSIKSVYIDPSAEAMQLELKRRGIHAVHANNDVQNGIQIVTQELKTGRLFIMEECTNLIREIESYVWDPKEAAKGYDEPYKKDDHACVTGDTKILLLNGRQETIKELSEKIRRQATFYNYNCNTDRIEKDTYRNPSLTRERAEIYELELEDGKKLRCTADHQIMTQRGFVELRQLMLCDIVMTCNINTTSERNFI